MLYVTIVYMCVYDMTSLVVQIVKRLPTMRETWVQSLGREDLLEKKMATHSSILAWKIPWTEKPGRLQSMGSQESDTTEWLFHSHFHDIHIPVHSIVSHLLNKSSSCELSKMQVCVPSMSGMSEIAAHDDPSALPSPTSSPSSSQ